MKKVNISYLEYLNLYENRLQINSQPALLPVSVTYVMLFWCSVSRVVLRSSVVALLSMFLKRSMAEMFLWMLCFGRSSFDTNVSAPPSSQRNSMGQQSWP